MLEFIITFAQTPVPQPTVTFWERVFFNYGPLWALIILTAWYVGPLLKQMMESHNHLVNTLAEEAPKQTKAWEDTARASEASALLLDEHKTNHDAVVQSLEQVHTKLDEIRNRERHRKDGTC